MKLAAFSLPLEGRVAAKRPGGVATAALGAFFAPPDLNVAGRLERGRGNPLWLLRSHLPLKEGERAQP
jgi:hypothetical protein